MLKDFEVFKKILHTFWKKKAKKWSSMALPLTNMGKALTTGPRFLTAVCSPTKTIQKENRAAIISPCRKSFTTNIHGQSMTRDSISTGAGLSEAGEEIEKAGERDREREGVRERKKKNLYTSTRPPPQNSFAVKCSIKALYTLHTQLSPSLSSSFSLPLPLPLSSSPSLLSNSHSPL